MEVTTPRRASARRFRLGRVFATPAALSTGVSLAGLVDRHAACDWGDVGADDAAANDAALDDGTRLFSAYETAAGRIWVITEADRSSTTVLLPSDY